MAKKKGRRKQNRKQKARSRILRLALRLLLLGLLLTAGFVLSIYLGLWGRIPDTAALKQIRLDRASEIYTCDSVLIGKFYLSDRQPIPLEAVPKHTIDALISIEDQRYYRHSGVDYPSLLRVFFKNILLGDSGAGGGSTLSQQLAKNLYPRNGGGSIRLVADKVREMIIARRLESAYGKEGVLHLYLNTVSFGDNTFGIESASRRFYGKSARELKPEESAVLVGMLKGTYSYNPRHFPQRSLARRNLVLGAMQASGYLEATAADSLSSLPLHLDYQVFRHDQGTAPYFREAVRKEILEWLDSSAAPDSSLNLYTSGLKIYTTLDSRLQKLAESALKAHLPGLQAEFEEAYGTGAPWKRDAAFIEAYARDSRPYRKLAENGWKHRRIMDSLRAKRRMTLSDWNGSRTIEASTLDSLLFYSHQLQAGNLAMDGRSGAVLAWVGGIDFERFKFDHVSQSRRQTGSTFKPIVYTAALESGLDPCSYFSARRVRYTNLEDWTPANSGDKDEAYLNYSMAHALTHSVNTVSVKVLEETGIRPVLRLAGEMGIKSKLPGEPSLALGTGSVPMVEMAAAYSTYINAGRPANPYLIRKVEDARGRELYRHQEAETNTAFSEDTRRQMLDMLQSVVDEGTASRLRTRYGFRGPIAGKTGTTQKNRDAWFVALTPRLVHLSWVGLDHYYFGFPNTRIGQGANAALPLFANWYRELRNDPALSQWTRGSFGTEKASGSAESDCPPIKKDGFFKRLFTNPKKARKGKFKNTSGK